MASLFKKFTLIIQLDRSTRELTSLHKLVIPLKTGALVEVQVFLSTMYLGWVAPIQCWLIIHHIECKLCTKQELINATKLVLVS